MSNGFGAEALWALNTKAGVAAALSALETNLEDEAVVSLLDEAFACPKGVVIGITGPPGAGKSTLIDALITGWRKEGHTVAVVAVDPSSKSTRGALLGDRVRMRIDPTDTGVFIRSMAARGRLGGLADAAYPAAVLLRALYDKVIVETVGVGQSETDIATVSDTVVLCIQPASGDSLQFMKAGIAEIPDVAVVTKADMGAAASRALADLKGALSLFERAAETWEPHCLSISATNDRASLGPLFAAIAQHTAWLEASGALLRRRSEQARSWVESEVCTAFGLRGLSLAKTDIPELFQTLPFSARCSVLGNLRVIRNGNWSPS